ncbi:RNA pseudouridine synthase [Treponema sp. OMZ 792]|uniref:RluA family pseudouridine synthase n=1 Tax=unclassified Treponema TaxID=2638727 RepID=UPI0020A28020|nr:MULTISPECIES: RNA pseudouridine synthase [unclassified Treponema]UTC75649.1 RNA pseudouridine synthase [Treponema sp. OMZ 792]UTC79650.1 RNA pseudouridine synthase [Treponema sp. OMZ 798]
MQNEVRILFEDNFFAVVLKNCGDNSQTFFKKAFSEKKYAEAVNRLDKPVSGLVLVAFSPQIHTKLNNLFKEKSVKKEYWAICKKREEAKTKSPAADFKINPKSLYKKELCEAYLEFNTKIQKGFVTESKQRGKKASLYWELSGIGDNYNFLRVFPETGRTHQIRIQLAHLGMPIKGDIKYGFERTEKSGGIRLHAYSLNFCHPQTKKQIEISALPPSPDKLWSACIEACLKAKEFDK